MSVFKNHGEAIDWTMTDINGLSPAIIQHLRETCSVG